jgi:epoxyqueuosine reductase
VTLQALALTSAIKARALELGFDRAGVGPAGPPAHGAAFERWLAAGYAGEMDYLARGRADRLDPARLLPGARSVLALAMLYARDDDGVDWTPVARYARGRDYHDVIRPRLARLVEFIREAAGPGVRSRAAIDTSAVLERDLAAAAGLGWIGKNTNVLSQDLGSHFFIAIVLTSAELVPDGPLPDRCGTCTACLDACPTRAFVAPYVLDARRCISYLTIEHRGAIPAELRGELGDHVFGCDVCQDVCPWNRKAPTAREPALAPSEALGELEGLLGLDDAAFRARFRPTALWRARRAGVLRNAALVLGNRRMRPSRAALERALADPAPLVRDAAAWALGRIDTSPDGPPLAPLPGTPSGKEHDMDNKQSPDKAQRDKERLPQPGREDVERPDEVIDPDRSDRDVGEPLQLDHDQKVSQDKNVSQDKDKDALLNAQHDTLGTPATRR